MSSKSGKKLTKQEELLLQDFSRNVSTKSSALFYGNAVIVSIIPICKWHMLSCHVNGDKWLGVYGAQWRFEKVGLKVPKRGRIVTKFSTSVDGCKMQLFQV